MSSELLYKKNYKAPVKTLLNSIKDGKKNQKRLINEKPSKSIKKLKKKL